MTTILPGPMPPVRAIDYLRKKSLVPSFHWQDFETKAHATAFTVAKMMQTDLLDLTHKTLLQALEEGWTRDQFIKALGPELERKGWWGRKEGYDPLTGEIRKFQLGSARRLGIIYQTNMRTAYAAAQWARIKEQADDAPWLRYNAVDDSRTREQHRAWDGIILPYNHQFWLTHFPPNGWFCRCWVDQLSHHDLTRLGLKPTKEAPDVKMRTLINPRTEKPYLVPEGIDPGFQTNVGETWLGTIQGAAARSINRAVSVPPLPQSATDAAVDRMFGPNRLKNQGTLQELDRLPTGLPLTSKRTRKPDGDDDDGAGTGRTRDKTPDGGGGGGGGGGDGDDASPRRRRHPDQDDMLPPWSQHEGQMVFLGYDLPPKISLRGGRDPVAAAERIKQLPARLRDPDTPLYWDHRHGSILVEIAGWHLAIKPFKDDLGDLNLFIATLFPFAHDRKSLEEKAQKGQHLERIR